MKIFTSQNPKDLMEYGISQGCSTMTVCSGVNSCSNFIKGLTLDQVRDIFSKSIADIGRAKKLEGKNFFNILVTVTSGEETKAQGVWSVSVSKESKEVSSAQFYEALKNSM